MDNNNENKKEDRYSGQVKPNVLQFDQFETFKDQSMMTLKKNLFTPQLYYKRRNSKIVNIYNKIASNNAKDPLFPTNKIKTSLENISNQIQSMQASPKKQKVQKRTAEKFVHELISSLAKAQQNHSQQSNNKQKIKLLKRIIEHYNLKSKSQYSNLINSFGLEIERQSVQYFTSKKNLHPRKANHNMIRIKPHTSQQSRKNKNTITFKTIEPTAIILCRQPFLESNLSGLQLKQKIKKQQPKRDNQSAQNQKKAFTKTFYSQKMRKSLQFTNNLIHKPFRRNNDNDTLQHKINKFRQFLFILNLANRQYVSLDIEKYPQPFKYYVGCGNNANLIKSIMKRRFWFEQTKNNKQAQFIWTQIKNQQIYSKQQSKTQKIEKHLHCTGSQQLAPKIIFKKSSRNFRQDNALVQKILIEQQMRQYSTIMDMVQVNKKQYFNQRKRYLNKIEFIEKNTIIHNHLQMNGFLGNKKALFYSLREYCKLTQKNVFDMIPLTFHIKKGYLDEQFKSFMNIFLEKKKNKKSNAWIMKPGEFSNRGQGITCSGKIEQIRKRVSSCKNGNQTLILQSYITNPLLYNYRKFDIRVYMMITSHNGKIRAYWYQDGYIRTSSFQWRCNQFEDNYIHLTNDAVQKNCYQYGKYQPGNKLSFIQLQRYLETLPPNGRNMDFFGNVYPKLKQIAAETVKATYLFLDPKRYENNFEIFGLDFMIDDKLKPWLIEVNTNPCLQLSCPLLQRIIPYMIENAFRISLDPLFPPPNNFNSTFKYIIPENALYYNKFELIFDEDKQGQLLKNLYTNSNLTEQIDNIDEDKQQYQQEGVLIDLQNL